MKTSRRTFIKAGATAMAAAAFFPKSVLGSVIPSAMVGLQLYSVREDMMKDPLGTLTLLAKMGYVYVEHANYIDRKFYGYQAKEFRKILVRIESGKAIMIAISET